MKPNLEKIETRRIATAYGIVLTLSAKQKHTDQEITESLFFDFIKQFTEKYNIDKFFFLTEKNKGNQIFCKIIIPEKPVKTIELTDLWNNIQNKKGFSYVDEYEDIHSFSQPYSVDVSLIIF